jgi:hypothetical protein
MSAIRTPLRRMLAKLCSPTFTLTEDAIRQARCRARKTGKPDPYPWVLNRAVGRPVPLADLPGYNEAARCEGWPLWPMPVDYKSDGGAA